MHLFKHFFKMVVKHKTTLIIYTVIFVVMMTAFVMNGGFGNTEETKSVDDSSYTIGYIDNSDSAVSRGLIGYLSGNNELIDLKGKSEDTIRTMVYFTTVNISITIDEDFTSKIENGDDTAISFISASNEGPSQYIVESMINNYIKTYNAYVDLGFEPEEAVTRTTNNLSLKADAYVLTVDADAKPDAEGKLFTLCYMSKFFIYISFSVLCQCVGMVIIKNNMGKVNSRVNVSPVSPLSQSVVNVLGLLVCGIVLWIIACALLLINGAGMSVMREYGYAIFIILLFMCICNCSLTSFISSFAISADSLPMITNIIGLAMSFLCGVFVPQSVMNAGVVNASRFLPFYWAVVVLDSVNSVTGSITEYSPRLLLTSVLMLTLFSAIFTVGGIVVKKTQTYSKI